MEECYKSSTPPWVFLTFFKLYEWHQIAQHTTFGQETRPTDRYSHGQYFFRKTFHDLEDWVLIPDPF